MSISLLFPAVAAGEAISEQLVVQRALALPEAVAARAEHRLREAELQDAKLWPDPVLEWEREHVRGAGEDVVLLSLPVPLGPRRDARIASSAVSAASARADLALTRSELVTNSLLLFYEAVAARRRVEILEETSRALEEAAGVLEARREAGSASGYDTSRLAVARELAGSSLREARADVSVLEKRLGAWLGITGTVTGELSLGVHPERPELGALAFERHDALGALEDAARTADEAVTGWWFPDLVLSAGWKRETTGEVGNGYVAGVAVELPFFDRGQTVRARSEAAAMVARARLEARQRIIRSQVVQAHERLVTTREELERFRSRVTESVSLLLGSTLAGYREGERSVIELVDARRAQVDVALRLLELEKTAKQAEVRLRSATGEWR